MAKKPNTAAPEEAARLDDDQLASAVRASAQQIWQAGLGAFAKAQQEGARGFSKLVRDGTELQKRARKVEEATGTVARAAERASRRGTSSWGKLEQVFEERVARALTTIGVPARTEIEELKHRIAELERMLAALADRQHAQAAPAPAAKRARTEPVTPAPATKRARTASVTPAAAAGPGKPASKAAPKAATKAAPKAPARKTVGKPPRGGVPK
jgi:poly(hydroxyalkanoate) granule-associated protein